ncbi:MAG: transcription-repair coupling factor [Chitinophagales bacterium]|nr:transcription-repair coupling factor [Chitinophagales bacterium]MDW8393246.1 transcription-repair coupling factor [Chitinophagales bacterium]
MNKKLLGLFSSSEPVQQAVTALSAPAGEKPPVVLLHKACGSAPAWMAAYLFEQLGRDMLCVCNNREDAAYFFNDIQHLAGERHVHFFTDSFRRPGAFDRLLSSHVQLRTQVLGALTASGRPPQLVVTYPEALLERVPAAKALSEAVITLRCGQTVDQDELAQQMQQKGFAPADFVYEPGQFAVRGCIMDVFSYGSDLPFRIEFSSDNIESLRTFDPLSQVSEARHDFIRIVANTQQAAFRPGGVPLPALLPAGSVLWMANERFCLDRLDELAPRAETAQTPLNEAVDVTGSESKWIAAHELQQSWSAWPRITLTPDPAVTCRIAFNQSPQPSIHKQFPLLIEQWSKLQAEQYRILLFSDSRQQLQRLEAILEDLKAGITYQPVPFAIQAGFIDHDVRIACFTDHQIFDRYHRYRLREGYSQSRILALKLLAELNPGDYVTHIDHGVGIFSGLEKIEVNGIRREAVRLVYRDKDLLYVDIQSLHKISRYVGKDGTPPRVNKLGSAAWEQLKRRVKDRIQDISKELIALYAERRATRGFAFSPDTYLQTELEASFMYEDTPDQLKATRAVKADMEKSFPMDRLICGDVGFGKTEVAIRAAFKAVADGKQVAVLVPTTILALQHHKTFAERLSEFPCTVDYLNRFKTASEQKATLRKLEEGRIDIIIGTTALLGKRVRFKDLGLLIVDEEQKFGVAAKEQIRKLRTTVDTLTLTATPIPRTLQFSLMGARDLSIINTPPPNRQPIETEHIVMDADRIRDAIRFEVERGGQVFFIHNRIRDIDQIAELIRQLCPEYQVAAAHGQMKDEQLEEIMIGFIEHRYDVLVCTNIVESGLDIPNANTILINDAHLFGLSDLHQLRGRVGRSNRKAFCYLITPPASTLTEDARRRLRTIEEFTDLGSGFLISMRDLDIRGAGNILGAEQSGFITEIGYETYMKILDEALRELRRSQSEHAQLPEALPSVSECTVEADVELLIPDDYVSNINERLALYTELDKLQDEGELQAFAHRLVDRFGPMPQAVHRLMQAMHLRLLARRLGLAKVQLRGGIMKWYTVEDPDSPFYDSEAFSRIMQYVTTHPHRCQLVQRQKNMVITIRHVADFNQALRIFQELNAVGAEADSTAKL